MKYLSREMAIQALTRMRDFESTMAQVHGSFGLEFRSNLGRRNMLISQAQEVFFAEQLRLGGHDVSVDGRTGEPDIVIHSVGRELECKLTSGCGGSWALQTDYVTLTKKGSLDYLYVLANETFTEFAVLHFEGLTPNDFHPPAAGAREKARMRKDVAMEKCDVLIGSVTLRNDAMVEMYSEKISAAVADMDNLIDGIQVRINAVSERAKKRREHLEGVKKRTYARCERKIDKLCQKRNAWGKAPKQFTISLENPWM